MYISYLSMRVAICKMIIKDQFGLAVSKYLLMIKVFEE